MKKIWFPLILIFLLPLFAHAVSVDGYCYLENQTNHEGTKVLFQADSPSAVTDSVFSDSNGFFQLDINPGIYDIIYYHQGYFPEVLANQFINTNITLENITLISTSTQISGYAFFEDSIQHSGIDVTFIAQGVDSFSVETDSFGFYQIILNSQTYSIYYSYFGFDTLNFANQYLHGIIEMPDIILSPAPFHISGNLSGVLTKWDYIVDGNIFVEDGDSLVLEPGVKFLFGGWFQFTIHGFICAVGTIEDSIYFQPADSINDWRTFEIDYRGLSPNEIELAYCYFRGAAESGLNCYDTDITISNCTFTSNEASWGGGIYCNNSDVTLSNCEINDNFSTSAGGLYFTQSSAIIDSCYIHNNIASNTGGGVGSYNSNVEITYTDIISNSNQAHGGGVYISGPNSNSSIKNCFFGENSAPFSGGGIRIQGGESVTIESSLFCGNYCGYDGGGISIISVSNFTLVRNITVCDNIADSLGGGIYCYNYSNSLISNAIINDNSNYGVYIDINTNAVIEYCNLYENERGNFSGPNVPPYAGELITTNTNGDSCDTYMNIFLDPLFQSTTGDSAFRLTSDSPCIDAGDPESPLDPDSTIADIGAYYFHQNLGVKENTFSLKPSAFSLHPPYPNPFNPETSLRFDLPKSGHVLLTIYNIMGEEIVNLVDETMEAGSYAETWDAEGIPSGIYFARLTTENASSIQKLLLLK